MSIQSEITRISGNVSDAFTAITNKGVTVPAGSTSDDLADLISQISSGGGGAISIVDTPDSAGGTVRTITAVDISDTTAIAGDVAQGKYFYTADGTKTAGMAPGGGGGLEYEAGTWTPTEDIAMPIISFVNSHTEVPIFVGMIDTSSESTVTSQSDILFLWFDPWKAFDSGFPYTPSNKRYETAFWLYMGSSTVSTGSQIVTHNSDDPASTSSTYARYWVTNTGFKPNVNSASRYWRSGRTYKWIAVWAPTA